MKFCLLMVIKYMVFLTFFINSSRCLGIGIAFGRFISDGDMTPLMAEPTGLPSEEASGLISGASFVTKATWSPKQPQFELLNTVTDRGTPREHLRSHFYPKVIIVF